MCTTAFLTDGIVHSTKQVQGGDPRRPAEIKPYSPELYGFEEPPVEVYLMGSLFSGMLAMLLKWKIASWVSILFVLCAIANMRAGNADVKAFISSIFFSTFALFSAYLGPNRQSSI